MTIGAEGIAEQCGISCGDLLCPCSLAKGHELHRPAFTSDPQPIDLDAAVAQALQMAAEVGYRTCDMDYSTSPSYRVKQAILAITPASVRKALAKREQEIEFEFYHQHTGLGRYRLFQVEFDCGGHPILGGEILPPISSGQLAELEGVK